MDVDRKYPQFALIVVLFTLIFETGGQRILTTVKFMEVKLDCGGRRKSGENIDIA